MEEQEPNLLRPFIIVVPSHGFEELQETIINSETGDIEVRPTTYPTATGLERIIAAHDLYSRKLEEGYDVRVIFTGGQRSEDGSIPPTSAVMAKIFSEMVGTEFTLDSIEAQLPEKVRFFGNSRETQGNIIEVFVNLREDKIPPETEVIFLSQAYHDFGKRFERLIKNHSFEYTNASFQSIESLGIDLRFTPESLRFTQLPEIAHVLVLSAGRLLDKVFNKGAFKIEVKLYPQMSKQRKKDRDI